MSEVARLMFNLHKERQKYAAQWTRGTSKTGKTYWQSSTNPSDKRYQENMPGERGQGEQQGMPGVPPGWEAYEEKVRALEAEGMDRSDAQGIVDMEMEQQGTMPQPAQEKTPEDHVDAAQNDPRARDAWNRQSDKDLQAIIDDENEDEAKKAIAQSKLDERRGTLEERAEKLGWEEDEYDGEPVYNFPNSHDIPREVMPQIGGGPVVEKLEEEAAKIKAKHGKESSQYKEIDKKIEVAKDKLLKDFIGYLQAIGVGVELKEGDNAPAVKDLKPTQTHGKSDKVNFFAELMDKNKWNWKKKQTPVIVSSDGYILDGHHRWAGQMLGQPEKGFDVMVADLDIESLLKVAHTAKHTGYKSLGGSVTRPAKRADLFDGTGVNVTGGQSVNFASQILGRDVNQDDLAAASGAPPNTDLKLDFDHVRNEYHMTAGSDAPDSFLWDTSIYRNEEGDAVMRINMARVPEADQGQGLGSRSFSSQVIQAEKLGLEKVVGFCAGGSSYPQSGMNGYYTWALAGMDGPLPSTVESRLPENRRGQFKTVQECVRRMGADWWKENGDAFNGTFDTGRGSFSRHLLDAYLAESFGQVADRYQLRRPDGSIFRYQKSEEPMSDADKVYKALQGDGGESKEEGIELPMGSEEEENWKKAREKVEEMYRQRGLDAS